MDRQLRRFLETRVVTINEVDMSQYFVTATDQYGTRLHVSMHLTDGGVTSIPAPNEIWTIGRSGNEWFLEKKSDDGTELTNITDLSPGDKRIEASGNLYLNSPNLLVNGNPLPTTTSGTLAFQPLSANATLGSFYYATDQDVLYLNTGIAWQRLGMPAGVTTMWFGSAAPTGWVKYDGASLPSSTGIYTHLATHLGGTATPNTQGRMPVGLGTHADVATIGNNDGLAVGARRPKHNHAHTLAISGGSHNHAHYGGQGSGANPSFGHDDVTYLGPSNSGEIVAASHTHPTGEFSGSIGPQTGNEPTDGPAYITFLFIAKL